MKVELAFFEGDDLLSRGEILISKFSRNDKFASNTGHQFQIQHQFDEPACPITIQCMLEGEELYNGELCMGVHDSDDWESINLGDTHTLGFRCFVMNE